MLKLSVKFFAFKYFCAGATMSDLLATASLLGNSNIRSIVDSASEDGETETDFAMNYVSKLNLIKAVNKAENINIKYIPIKLSSIISKNFLINMAKVIDTNPRISYHELIRGLDPDGRLQIEKFMDRLNSLCQVYAQH